MKTSDCCVEDFEAEVVLANAGIGDEGLHGVGSRRRPVILLARRPNAFDFLLAKSDEQRPKMMPCQLL